MAAVRRNLLVLAIAASALAGCPRRDVRAERDPTPVVSTGAPTAPPSGIPADLRIVLYRTMCKGHCPAYTIVIDASGKVTFTGVAFVAEPHAEGKLTEAELRELLAQIDAERFFSLTPAVHAGWKDCPRAKTTITLAGKTAAVRDGCVDPSDEEDQASEKDAQAIERLDREIDRVVGSDRWIGQENARKSLYDEPDATKNADAEW
jgi:hypothetical protein